MKKNLLLFVLFILIKTGILHAQTYSYSQSTLAYSDISGATTISTGTWDEFDIFTITIPFSFSFFDGNFTTLYINNGTAMFHNPSIMAGYEMYVCDAALMDRAGASPISYLVSGITGSRILKVEWKNAGFSENVSGTDYANFQLWLYEGSNKIEYHFGTISVSDAYSWDTGLGPTTAILNSNGSELILLTGNPSSPTVNTNYANGIYLTGAPSANMVYIFTRTSPTGITNNISGIENNIYPNPFSNEIFIEKSVSSDAEIRIINMIGESVYQNNHTESVTTINTEALSIGVYLVEIKLNGNTVRKKMVKN